MGVIYNHYLITKVNYFQPTKEQLASFINELVSNKFVWDPASEAFGKTKFDEHEGGWKKFAAKSGAYIVTQEGPVEMPFPVTENCLEPFMQKDFSIMWPVDDWRKSDLHYPLTPAPGEDAPEVWYSININMSVDYVYRNSELIDPFDDVNCVCGQDLEYDVRGDKAFFCGQRISYLCPECSQNYDIRQLSVTPRNPFTAQPTQEVRGGASYRFALLIDCDESYPSYGYDGDDIKVLPELKNLCEKIFDQEFYEVNDVG